MTMSPLAARAIAQVILDEGGLVDDPSDPGGLTNMGFALNRNPDLTADAIRAMNVARATDRYFVKWWQPYRWEDLPAPIALKVFNLAVPDGPDSAIRALQRACWAAGKKVPEDGVLGVGTVGAAGFVATDVLLAALKSELAAHFRLVAAARPLQAKDLPGWLARAYRDVPRI
jgi:lysozyme family protein